MSRYKKSVVSTDRGCEVSGQVIALSQIANSKGQCAHSSMVQNCPEPLHVASSEASTSSSAKHIQRTTQAVSQEKDKTSRLEQNRRAARQSRQKKKCMVDGLQKSAAFFREHNVILRQQNDELSRLLKQAESVVIELDKVQQTEHRTDFDFCMMDHADELSSYKIGNPNTLKLVNEIENVETLNTASSIAEPPEALFQPELPTLPSTTMQAMSNFQNAAATAMQAAMQGIQGMTSFNMSHCAPSTIAQLAYAESMTAKAMEQSIPSRESEQGMDGQTSSTPGIAFLANSVFPSAANALVQEEYHSSNPV